MRKRIVCAFDSHYSLVQSIFQKRYSDRSIALSLYRKVSAGLVNSSAAGGGAAPPPIPSARGVKLPAVAAKAAAERRYREATSPPSLPRRVIGGTDRPRTHGTQRSTRATHLPSLKAAASDNTTAATVLTATTLARSPVILWRDSWRAFYTAAPATTKGAHVDADGDDDTSQRGANGSGIVNRLSYGVLQRGFVCVNCLQLLGRDYRCDRLTHCFAADSLCRYQQACFSQIPGMDEVYAGDMSLVVRSSLLSHCLSLLNLVLQQLCNKNQLTRKLCIMKDKFPALFRFYPRRCDISGTLLVLVSFFYH